MLTATFNSYGNRQISIPNKINTPEPIDKKIGTVDYVREGTPDTEFGTDPPTEGFWANGWNITKIIFIYTSFFPGTRTGRTRGWIFTRDSSKDVKSCKDVAFGGLNDVPLNFGPKTPQKLKFWAWIGLSSLNDKNFKRILLTHNLKPTDPIMTTFLQGVRTTSVRSWVVPRLPQQIQDGGGRHL